MFILTVFEILVLEGRSVLYPAQRLQAGKEISIKNQKIVWLLSELLEK